MMKVAVLLLLCAAMTVRANTHMESGSVAPSGQECSQYGSCPDCVKHHLCGWCSQPVIYPNNKTGTQCAGFNPHGQDPFQCNGIYSTDKCVAGYVCNKTTYTCELGPLGTGNTLKQCEADCYNHGHVYLCNMTTHQCYKVPPGTKGSSSYAVCEAECTHPSHHPAPPPPPPSPAPTYSCNYTSGQCYPAKAGHGKSMELCEQECKKGGEPKYLCNTFLHQCYKLPNGTPGGYNKSVCEEECHPKPNPGPPPSFLGGLWRGIEVQNDYTVGEWDMEFTATTATIVDVSKNTRIVGVPYNVKNGESLDLWIKVSSGEFAGKYIKVIGQKESRGPETTFLMAAFGTPGGPTPTSINDAFTAEGQRVFALSQCIPDVGCKFTLPPGKQERLARVLAEMTDDVDAEELAFIKARLDGVDPCEQYGRSCNYCLQHKYCGWCSTDVIYNDGKKGSQCAGFDPNPHKPNPFVCNGRFSTFNCTQGYSCDEETFQCKANPTPGNGLPKKECEELCHPTQTPVPAPDQWVCNMTVKKCFKCEEVHCPGSMPKQTCETACVHPKPGPSNLVVGSWRGIQINNGYVSGEFELTFNDSSVSAYKNDKFEWSGTVDSFGGDVMYFHIMEGVGAGDKFGAVYTIADQGNVVEYMTIAFGKVGDRIPTTYEEAMTTSGMTEAVLNRCGGKPCKFHKP